MFLFDQDNYSMQKIGFFFFFTDIAFLDIYSIRKVRLKKVQYFHPGNLTALVAPHTRYESLTGC